MTPNGNHRLTALKELGAKTVLALLVPEHEVAYQILALNIEKAHNLREKALEVVRMYRDLARLDGDEEDAYALEFEEPALVTLGLRLREAAAAVGRRLLPGLRKVDGWQRASSPKAAAPSASGARTGARPSTRRSARRSRGSRRAASRARTSRRSSSRA